MLDALFPFTRAIGRKAYALRLLGCTVISAPVVWWRSEVVQTRQPTEALIFLLVLIVVLVIIQAQVIGRLRDMHASILISGLIYVPYVNAALALALLLFPGVEAPAPARSPAIGG